MSDQSPDVEAIFQAAVGLESSSEREAFLRQQCGDDQQLLDLLRQRLDSHTTAANTAGPDEITNLEATVIRDPTVAPRIAAMDAGLASAFHAGETVVLGSSGHSVLKSLQESIHVPQVRLKESSTKQGQSDPNTELDHHRSENAEGRYRLESEIARGGMGAVLKGRDNDLGRDLAIKVLLDSHKDNPQVIQRFVEEAQIGGQLQHPGIAPVYELGQLADRRPFFSMKLVQGETLARLLTLRGDATQDRGRFLGIFEQICQTMAYAHSRGVVHRDLKPANVMVGAFGEVQVMDWGLAKVLTDEEATSSVTRPAHGESTTIRTRRESTMDSLDDDSTKTQMGSVMGTPAYMPPEQATGQVDQLDQRADVFGLGAILCEILTGKPPYVGKNGLDILRQAADGNLDDAFRRLKECGADSELLVLARECLASDPAERPTDAAQLAARVTGYLESVESKLRQTELERASEAARVVEQKKRMRITMVLASAVLLALTGGIIGTAWQARQAEIARVAEAKRAESESIAKTKAEEARFAAEESAVQERLANAQAQKRLQQILKTNDILTSIFVDLDPNRIARKKEPLQAILAESLDKAVDQLDGEAIGDALLVARMQAKLGWSLLRLGFPDKAVRVFENSYKTHQETLGADHRETVTSMNDLAAAYQDAGELRKALPLFERSLELRRAASGEVGLGDVVSINNLASAYSDAGKYNEAIELLEEALNLQRELGDDNENKLTTINTLAATYMDAGLLDKAFPLFEEGLKLRKASLGAAHPDTLISMSNLGVLYINNGKYEQAKSLLEETVALSRETLGEQHPSTLVAICNLAVAYSSSGDIQEAVRLNKMALEAQRSKLGPNHPDTIMTMANLGKGYLRLNQFAEAGSHLAEAVSLAKETYGPNHLETSRIMYMQAQAFLQSKQTTQGLTLLEELNRTQAEALGPGHPDTMRTVSLLATTYQSSNQHDKAITLLEQQLTTARDRFGPDHSETISVQNQLAKAFYHGGFPKKSATLLRESVELNKATLGPDHPNTHFVMKNLGAATHAAGVQSRTQGDLERALSLLEESLEVKRAAFGPDHRITLLTLTELATTYLQSSRTDDGVRLLRERLAIVRGTNPAGSTELASELTLIGSILLQAKVHAEAESLIREALIIRENASPDSWELFNTRSLLGEALAGQEKYKEAEPSLLEGYEGLQRVAASIPEPSRGCVVEAVERLVAYYVATDNNEEVARWQTVLQQHKSAEAKNPDQEADKASPEN